MDAPDLAVPPSNEDCWDFGADPVRVARARRLLHNDEFYYHLSETFRALSDTTRAKIVHALLHQELCSCDLAAVLGMTAPAVSHHLRTLRQLRLVKSRREGKLVYYSLDDDHIQILLDVAAGHIQHIAGVNAGGSAGQG